MILNKICFIFCYLSSHVSCRPKKKHKTQVSVQEEIYNPYDRENLLIELKDFISIPVNEIYSERVCEGKHCFCDIPEQWKSLPLNSSSSTGQEAAGLHVADTYTQEIPSSIVSPPHEVISNSNFNCTNELQTCSIFNGYDLLTEFCIMKKTIFDENIRSKFDTFRCVARSFYYMKPMFRKFVFVLQEYWGGFG